MSVNKAILVGRLGKDPETRYMTSGEAVTNATLATSENWKDKSGEKQEKTEWHNLVFYRRLAEVAGEYLKKGAQIYVEGKIQTRSWDDKDSGQKKYRTEILVNEMSLLGGRGEGSSSSSGGSYSRSNTSSFDQRPATAEPDYADQGITDDDIPF